MAVTDLDIERLMRRLPLSRETVERITARMVATATAGVDPSSAQFPDLIIGTIQHDLYGSVALELDRAYDRLYTELPAKALPVTSDGLWLDNWAETLGLERKDATSATGFVQFSTPIDVGTPAVLIASGTEVSTEQASEDAPEIVFQTTAGDTIPVGGGTIELPVEAIEQGAQGNVAAGTVTIPSTPVDPATFTNADAITGGSDVETDAALSFRVWKKLSSPPGAGNVADYEGWCLAWPGVGFVTVQPAWAGPNTVRNVVTDIDNNPVSKALTDALQLDLDPIPGEGRGRAPVGAVVTVATPVSLKIDIVSTIDPDVGYSLDGSGGTRPLQEEIEAALANYVNGLPVGQDVVRNKVIAAMVDVPGVEDVTALTINGSGAASIAVAALEVAVLDDVTLT